MGLDVHTIEERPASNRCRWPIVALVVNVDISCSSLSVSNKKRISPPRPHPRQMSSDDDDDDDYNNDSIRFHKLFSLSP